MKKGYCYYVLIAIDQLFNALLGGGADETLSSRTYRGAILSQQPKKRWRVLYRLINGIFFDKEHCKKAYESELKGNQHSKSYKRQNKQRKPQNRKN